MAKNSTAKHEAGKRAKDQNRGHKKGQGALKKGSAFKKSNASSKVGRTAPDGETNKKGFSHFRSENTIKRLNMYKSAPNADAKRRMKEQKTAPMRIQPDRRWFGNTRVITQDKMTAFRETIAKGVEDPFSVVLKASKVPMSLLKDTEDKVSRMDLLSVQPFSEVFGKGRQQKKVKLANYDLEAMLEATDSRNKSYDTKTDRHLKCDFQTGNAIVNVGTMSHTNGKHHSEEIFAKGTSKRIWGELYKVIDSSDVIVFILDARDPEGTRCRQLEREIRKTRQHKHVVLVLNKVDLVPTWVSRRWVSILMKDFPTLAFHASIANPFGKNALLNLLRQFSALLKDTKHVTVGMIGYPNVGKSSVINTLRRKKVCKAAPVPGETRIWQYVALTKRLYLLDCPGIVPPTAQDFEHDCAKVLKGVVRAERCETPSDYIDEVLSRTKRQYLLQKYKLDLDTQWADGEAFLTIIAHKMGKLFKGGEPDLETSARIVLYDWQRGRIPFFTAPPEEEASSSSLDPLRASAAGAADAAAAKPALEGDEQAAAIEDGEAGAEPAVVINQSFADLACSLEYDEDDRRGEALPSKGEKPADQANAKGGRKRPRQAPKGEDAPSGEEDGPPAPAQAEGGKKKPRRGGGGGGASGGGGGTDQGGVRQGGGGGLRPGVVDWAAVASEFSM